MKQFKGTPGAWYVEGDEFFNRTRGNIFDITYNSNTTCAEDEANARLIAAAPELLEALQCALEWIDNVPSDTRLPTMPGFDRDWVGGVINKALGE